MYIGMLHIYFDFNWTKFQTESSCTKGPIKQPNKNVQMKVFLLISAVRLNKLNLISVSSAEVEVEIFISNRVKPLHELQTVLDSLCLLPS